MSDRLHPGKKRGLHSEGVMSEITRILCAIERADSHASAQLLLRVYDVSRRLAAQ